MIFLSIFGFAIEISSDRAALLEYVRFDFGSYETSSSPSKIALKIINTSTPPSLTAFEKEHSRGTDWIQYRNHDSILVEYNHGQAGCIFTDGFKGTVYFFGDNTDFVYEKLYLFIMSRLGEYLEAHSFSRIHGFGLADEHGRGIIGLAPSGGGKSTLTAAILRQFPKIRLYSDDMPLLNKDLSLLPFKHRVSINESSEQIPSSLKRTFIRTNRSDKTVIHWKAYEQRWGDLPAPLQFVVSLRFTKNPSASVEQVGKIHIFCLLMRDMVIGYGLPQVVEFFLVNGFKSIIQKIPQFLTRILHAFRIARKARGCILWQSNNPSLNAQHIIKWIENVSATPKGTQ